MPPTCPMCANPWTSSGRKSNIQAAYQDDKSESFKRTESQEKTQTNFSCSILRFFYFSLIYPYPYYCSSALTSNFSSLLSPIRNLQLKAAKVLQSTIYAPVQFLKLNVIYTLSLCSITFIYFHRYLPECLSSEGSQPIHTLKSGGYTGFFHPLSAFRLWFCRCCGACLELYFYWGSKFLYPWFS